MSPAREVHDVTICTVSFHNAPHLKLNYEWTEILNQGAGTAHWVVAENSPPQAQDRLTAEDPCFQVIEGAPPGDAPNLHHTLALHKCFDYVKTRFALILDPDFYIVRPDWIDAVTQHMLRQELAFFGVPWHPRFASKYRYFPAVHCFFVDRSRVTLDKLDFRPPKQGTGVTPANGGVPTSRLLDKDKPASVVNWLGLGARRKTFTDTGTRVYQSFVSDPSIRYECALPVFRLPEDAPVSRAWRSRLLEQFLPDHLCYLPKRRNSYTSGGLRELGYLKDAPPDWEEFMWQGAPLGFHVRRNFRKAERNVEEEISLLRRALCEFARD